MPARTAQARTDELAPGPAQLAAVLDAGGGSLRRLLALTEERLAGIAAGSGDALAPHAADTLSAGGKRLRPMLVFICSGAVSEQEASMLTAAGVSIELLHMATLVHDDVLDRASLRRGRPTVFASAGSEPATATGDLLFARAFAELVATGSQAAVRALSAASSALVRGELMQRADAWSTQVTRERYIERCKLKTAPLFEAACRLGALFGEPGREAADALGEYGADIGVAFQIFDDVLDVAGRSERTGKLRGTDLLDGTVTLPLILARGRESALSLADLRGDGDRRLVAEALCERIEQTGALDEARQIALGYVDDAKAVLDTVDLRGEQRRLLELVADGVVDRYS
jgi:geranylgeranyl pyrophosphate synthase